MASDDRRPPPLPEQPNWWDEPAPTPASRDGRGYRPESLQQLLQRSAATLGLLVAELHRSDPPVPIAVQQGVEGAWRALGELGDRPQIDRPAEVLRHASTALRLIDNADRDTWDPAAGSIATAANGSSPNCWLAWTGDPRTSKR